VFSTDGGTTWYSLDEHEAAPDPEETP
jgi:hypothetical protein